MNTKKTFVLTTAALAVIVLLTFFITSGTGLSSVANTAENPSSNLIEVVPAASSVTGVVSVVQSGTLGTSSWTIGPDPDPIGTDITIDIRIDGATPKTVWGWAVDVNWDTSELQLTNVKEGAFLKSGGGSTFLMGGSSDYWNNVAGYIKGSLACVDNSHTSGQNTATSGILATLTFEVIGHGIAHISLPTAHISSVNTDTVGQIVSTKNATVIAASSTVFDVKFQETGLPDGTEWTATCNGQSTSSTTSEIAFSLIDGLYSYSLGATPGYVIPTRSGNIEVNESDITISLTFAPASTVGPNIDVFTDRGGYDQGVDSGPYGPEELIQIYAYVTFNNALVANQPVSFSIINQQGTVIALRTAQTNGTGYACLEYRLPWLDTGSPEDLFGQWSINATTSLSEQTVSDTTHFSYNYIVNVVNTNGIQLPATMHRNSTATVSVTVENIADSPQWSTLSITIYDEANIPIVFFNTTNNQAMGIKTVSAQFTIPTWAFIGQATAYVDILTNAPQTSGVPYCPEKVATFQIVP